MKTFLYLTGLIASIFGAAYSTATLLTWGWNEGLCWLLYLLMLAIIGGVTHWVNRNYLGYEDENPYEIRDYYTLQKPHVLPAKRY